MEAHKAAMDTCVEEALQQAGVTAQDLQAVAVSIGPGLSPCLKVFNYTGCTLSTFALQYLHRRLHCELTVDHANVM